MLQERARNFQKTRGSERLPGEQPIAECSRQAFALVACDNGERNFPRSERYRNGGGILSIEVAVDKGEMGVLAVNQRKSLCDR